MIRIEIEASIVNMEIMDLTNAIAIALANSPDMGNVRIHRLTVEEADA